MRSAFACAALGARGAGLGQVAVDVAHDGIELGERDAEAVRHGRGLARLRGDKKAQRAAATSASRAWKAV